jgi:hypothetical protein
LNVEIKRDKSKLVERVNSGVKLHKAFAIDTQVMYANMRRVVVIQRSVNRWRGVYLI